MKFHFSWLSGSNFMRAGGKHPPQTYTLSKSPVLIGLKSCSFLGVLSLSPIWLQMSEICSKVELRPKFEANITSVGVMLSISEVLIKYNLFQYFESWFNNSTSPTYADWKRIVRDKIQVFERDVWSQFCDSYPDMHPGLQTTQQIFQH